jgi:hypothetical protein
MFESIDITKRSKYETAQDPKIIYLFIIISASVFFVFILSFMLISFSTCCPGQQLVHYCIILLGNMVIDILFISIVHFSMSSSFLSLYYHVTSHSGIGLPLSYTQKKFDIFLDTIYGSKFMFRRRLWVSLAIIFLSLLFGPICGEYQTIFLVVLIGFCTWSCHGSVTTLASLVKYNSSTMQQIGFAFPGLISLILVHSLHMEGDVSFTRLCLFYYITAILILPGILAWVILCRSSIVREVLEGKDQTMSRMILQVANTFPASKRRKDRHDYHRFVCLNDEEESQQDLSSIVDPYPDADTDPDADPLEADMNLSLLIQKQQSPATLDESKQLLLNTPQLLDIALQPEPILQRINLHRWTLFLTLFISILQGSLLAYTCGCTLFEMDLPPLLYFIRIFSDLLGRPLALLPKPVFFSSIEGVLIGSVVRFLCSFYFFYVIHTISPHPSLLKNSFEQSFSLSLFQVSLLPARSSLLINSCGPLLGHLFCSLRIFQLSDL